MQTRLIEKKQSSKKYYTLILKSFYQKYKNKHNKKFYYLKLKNK